MNYKFLLYIIFFFIFNKNFFFKNLTFKTFEINFKKDNIFIFIQYLSLIFMSNLNRNLTYNFFLRNSSLFYINLNIFNFFSTYQNNFFFINNFNFINKLSFFFYLYNKSFKLKLFLFRLFLFPLYIK